MKEYPKKGDFMADNVYNWCCNNPECRMANEAEMRQVNEAVANRLKPHFICHSCGLIHEWVKTGTAQGGSWLECIPFILDWPTRIPTGRNPDGTFSSYKGGDALPDMEFRKQHGIKPDNYLKWRDAGKPRPAHRC